MGVLLQLPDGYVLMQPRGATDVAKMILDIVAEIVGEED
jgi:hypothetical protein